MSVFPAGEVGFFRLVEQTFLLLRGRGLVLSSRDTELVKVWQRAGAPARVVCQAIEGAFEAHGRAHGDRAAPPRSLAYCAPAVEEAIAGWVARSVGHNPLEEED